MTTFEFRVIWLPGHLVKNPVFLLVCKFEFAAVTVLFSMKGHQLPIAMPSPSIASPLAYAAFGGLLSGEATLYREGLCVTYALGVGAIASERFGGGARAMHRSIGLGKGKVKFVSHQVGTRSSGSKGQKTEKNEAKSDVWDPSAGTGQVTDMSYIPF